MIREALAKFFTYAVGNILQSALSFVLLPLYLRFFPPADYGVISVLSVTMTLLTLFSSAGIVNGLIRMYYEAQGDRRRQLVGNTWLWYLVVGGAGALVLLTQAALLSRALFGAADHQAPIRLVAAVFFFSMLRTVPLYVLRLEKRAGLYVGVSLFSFLIDFILKLLLIVRLGRGIPGYFESSAISSLLTLIVLAPLFAPYVRIVPDADFLKQLLRLGAPYIVSGLAVWTLDVSDRLLLSRFAGEAAVGIYSLAYNFVNMFTILLAMPVSLLLDPFFFAYSASHPEEQTKQILRRSEIYFFLAGGILYLGIALGSGELLRVFTTHFGARPQYLEAVKLVPILTMAPFFYFLTSQASLGGLRAKQPEIVSTSSLIAASVNLGLNLFVIPRWGAAGAAWTTLGAYLVLLILLYWQSERVYPVGYEWKSNLIGMVYLIIALVAGLAIWLPQPVFSLLTRVLAGLVVFGVLAWFPGGLLMRTERQYALTYITTQLKGLVLKEKRS